MAGFTHPPASADPTVHITAAMGNAALGLTALSASALALWFMAGFYQTQSMSPQLAMAIAICGSAMASFCALGVALVWMGFKEWRASKAVARGMSAIGPVSSPRQVDVARGWIALCAAAAGLWILAGIVQSHTFGAVMALGVLLCSIGLLAMGGLGTGLIWLAWRASRAQTPSQ